MSGPPILPPLPRPPAPESCGLALASLLLGISSLVMICLAPLTALPAVICGHLARARIRRSGHGLTGEGLALGGLVTGYMAIALLALGGLIAAVSIPRVTEHRQIARNETCVANLKAIQAAKTAWAVEFKRRPSDIPTDTDLFGPDKYLRQRPSCPENGVYSLNAVGEKPACSIPGHTY